MTTPTPYRDSARPLPPRAPEEDVCPHCGGFGPLIRNHGRDCTFGIEAKAAGRYYRAKHTHNMVEMCW